MIYSTVQVDGIVHSGEISEESKLNIKRSMLDGVFSSDYKVKSKFNWNKSKKGAIK